MWALIKRDLDQMVMTNLRSSGITHGIVGLIMVLMMWILGPHVFGFLEPSKITGFLLLIGMMVAGPFYTFSNLEEDASNRQFSFLQLLPIRKSQIVHAKFLSNLLVCAAAFIWALLLISANLLVNSTWSMDSLLMSLVFFAMLICVVASSLLWNFTLGNKRGFWYSYAVFIFWSILLVMLVGPIEASIDISFGMLSSITLIASAVAYLICWWVSVVRVRKKGFPKEVESVSISKEKAYVEDLKRRYAERKEGKK